ncbi:unnamed protein product [marine sediment metagenome]|uniref:Uncharacterized protein n=1 Tax=marine sediment metagenome TaxID=412755 RepID=X0ZHG2_9ZZZZ
MSWTLIFLAFILMIGCLVGVVVLRDVLTYLDLQRRLREERGKES